MQEKFLPVCEPTLLGKERDYILDALETGWISSAGKYVTEFEKSFAEYCDVGHGVAVCNGTVALHLALTALGIGPGHEVIIPNFTMIATAFAVCYTGALPVFVEADRDTWNIDPSRIEAKITSKTKAIMPVHIMGLSCDMDAIRMIAQKHDLYIIEDAAEAHGAEYKEKKTGSLSDCAAFSFFANKNLTTGEGGMVVTSNPELAEKLRYYKNLCFPLHAAREYKHANIGYNYRISNLHAAIGLAQVEKADEYREKRRKNNSLYRSLLREVPGIYFQKDSDIDYYHVHWMNAIVLNPREFGMSRDDLMAHLKSQGIDSRKLFTGMHQQEALRNFGCDSAEQFEISEWLGENGLYLPSASSLAANEIERVARAIREAQS
jgi:perosamine synthetase